MGKPTLEEFRRWLQIEIKEIEATEEGPDKEKRLTQLEMALQESMAFDAGWELRTASSITPVVKEKSVRLLSSAPESLAQSSESGICNVCEEKIDDDLEFCPSCGENR